MTDNVFCPEKCLVILKVRTDNLYISEISWMSILKIVTESSIKRGKQ